MNCQFGDYATEKSRFESGSGDGDVRSLLEDLLFGFQPGRVDEILWPARSFLVEKKLLPADNRRAHSFHSTVVRLG